MTTVVISQPMYFPWPGFLAQLALADVVVWLVDAQFSKGSFTNRVQVRLPSGPSWLSIPVKHAGSDTHIADLEAANPNWLDGHVAKLKQSLKKTSYLDTSLALVHSLRQYDGLCDALIASTEGLASNCDISPQNTYLSTDLNVAGHGSKRVMQIVQELNGTRYITGHGARNYLDHEAFQTEGIEVEYMNYDIKPWGPADDDFSPFVTGLDLLAHVGPSQAVKHLNPRTFHWREFLKSAEQS